MRHTMDQTVGPVHMDDAAFKTSMTFIEYHADTKDKAEYKNMEMMMDRLGAWRSPLNDTSPFCTDRRALISCSTCWN